MPLKVIQSHCPAGSRRCGVGQPLGEGQAWAVRFQAAEAPGLDLQPDRPPLPGQVVEHTVIPAVDSPGRRAAGRAGGPGFSRYDDDGEDFGRG
jgi:hypothetical protein